MDSVADPKQFNPRMSEIESQASELIRREKGAWDTGTAFVTDKVAFQMRNAIRLFRKNYWGVFDEVTDPVTGRKKTWIPFTEYLVEAAVKNIDLDTKDIDFRSKKPESMQFKIVLKQAVRNYLEQIQFGELLDMSERQGAIDGTFVWKTWEQKNSKGKTKLHVKLVDLLNFYIDPTADSIREAESVIERSLMLPEEIAQMDGWLNRTKNGDPLMGTNNFNRYDGQLPSVPSTTQGQVKMREVFERWGRMSKFLITGNSDDKNTQVEGRIVASSNASDWVIHLIEENKKVFDDGSPWRPYEEFCYSKVHGRWYGKGIAEKVMGLQIYLNTILGIRINRSFVQQLGLFKIRAGSNITPQMVGKLLANGALKVTDIEKDIAPLEFPESGLQESYKDEQNIINWGQMTTSLFDPVVGDNEPANTTATGEAIQNQASISQFTLIKESLGMFLTRWLKYHALPVIVKGIKLGDVVRITGEWGEVAMIDEWNVNRELIDHIEEQTKGNKLVDPNQILFEKQRAMSRLQKSGLDRYIVTDKNFDATEWDVEIMITNEEINKPVLLQNLVQMLGAVPPQVQPTIIREAFDLMGLDTYDLQNAQNQAQQQPQQPGVPGQPPQGQPQQPQQQPQQPMPQANMQRVVTGANQVNAAA